MVSPAPYRLKADVLMPLTVRSNAPAARRALGHLGAIVLAAATLWPLRGTFWALPLTALLGFFIAFLFNALHETAHQTAFRTRAPNHLLGHLAGARCQRGPFAPHVAGAAGKADGEAEGGDQRGKKDMPHGNAVVGQARCCQVPSPRLFTAATHP